MLIENKFFYISLPRCASYSFMASCVKYGLDIKHYDDKFNIDTQLFERKKKLSEVNYENFQHEFKHAHEPLNFLQNKFGNHYDIISVRRNKYERYISLWKKILFEMDMNENKKIFEICRNLNSEDILFYKGYNLYNDRDVSKIVDLFIEKHNLIEMSSYGKNILTNLIKPYSTYHHNNSSIIWFDFENLNQLEDWVSEKINIKFKLQKINSSKHYITNLILNDDFKKNYDAIYEIYDEYKNEKTVI